jgi:hypothetical protein
MTGPATIILVAQTLILDFGMMTTSYPETAPSPESNPHYTQFSRKAQ